MDMNTLVPEAWIIQEKIRREKEGRKEVGNSLPISLPEHSDSQIERIPRESSETNLPKEETVIVIDL